MFFPGDVIISIIVAVYNSEEYLRDCLYSIIDQTYRKLDIVIVDDGSEDKTPEICEDFARRDERISVIRSEHAGVLKARQMGLSRSVGKYVCVVDGDDWLEPDMIEKLYEGVLKNGAPVSMCAKIEENGYSRKIVRQGFKAGFYDRDSLEKKIYPFMISNGDFFSWGIFPSLWDKMIKRELIEAVINENTEMFPIGNDAVVTYPVLLEADSIEILDDCLYHYRQNSSSMVHNTGKSDEFRRGFKRLYNSLNNCFSKYSLCEELRKQWKEYLLFLMIPRSDDLMKKIYDRNELFPFHGVKKGYRVVVYGMGLYGQRVYRFLRDTGYCRVVAAVDRDFKEISGEEFEVLSPECIKESEFDAVIVTLSYADARKSATGFLRTLCPEHKIHTIDPDIAADPEILRSLGLEDL